MASALKTASRRRLPAALAAWLLASLAASIHPQPANAAVESAGAAVQTTMQAVVSMQGIRGSVVFEERSNAVRAEFKFAALNRTLRWEIREFPMLYDDSYRCADSRIGSRLGAKGSSGNITMVVGAASPSVTFDGQLLSAESGPASAAVAGRSILLTDYAGKLKVCATIQPSADVRMAEAIFTGCNSGRISFREVSSKYLAVISKMKFACYGPQETNRRLHLVYLPSNRPDSSKTCDEAVSMNETSRKPLYELRAGTTFFVLVGLTLEDIVGEQTMLLISSSAAAPTRCARVHFVSKRVARVKLSSEGVVGNITFMQNSPFEPTLVSYNVRGLRKMGGSFHVHQFPVPERMEAADQLCSSDIVAGHWNPFGIDNSRLPPSGTGTEDQYEIGDLSGKYGSWSGKDSATATNITDWNLPLFGPNRIIGRSFVIHNSTHAAHRWVCADIGFPETSITAVAYFQYPLIGQVVMTQSPEEPFGETTLFAQLGYTGDETTYDTRRFAVTSSKVGSDFDAPMPQRCLSAGSLWNPTEAIVTAGEACDSRNPFGCPVGELASRGCEIRVSPAASSWQKIFCTDVFLPLSGPFSIAGKSMTVYGADNRTALACADIVREMPLVATVSHWAGSQRIQGNITMRDTETALTILSVHIDGLQARASSYAIHDRPIHAPTGTEASITDFDCLSSAGRRYNPIQLPSSTAASPGSSMDQFVTGDLSGKHGMLDGLNSVNIEVLDSNLPLSGTNSVVGRSIVVKDVDGSALACGNLRYSARAMGARTIRAMANFSDVPGNEVTGYVIMTQVAHPDGAETSTTVEMQLQYRNTSQQAAIRGNAWGIHTSVVEVGAPGGACSSTGPRYNPFHRKTSSPLYGLLCNPYSSAMCELGDISSKLGAYTINGVPQVYTDVCLPLTGNFSVVGRSVAVYHTDSTSSAPIACADLLPVGQPTVLLSFADASFSKLELTKAIAVLLGTGLHNVAVAPVKAAHGHHVKSKQSCTQIRVYFTGFEAEQLSQRLLRDASLLGRFAPVPCSALTSFGLMLAYEQQHKAMSIAIVATVVMRVVLSYL